MEASWYGDLVKKLVRRPDGCEWFGARHLRSGGRATPSGSRCLVRVGAGPIGWTYLGGVGLIRGAGPIGLGLPQRGLGETGKSLNTTVKHHRVIVVCILVLYIVAIYIHRIKLLTCFV